MPSPWNVSVDVTLNSINPVSFTIDSKDLPKGSNGDLIFKNDGKPGFHINFNFTDGTGLGYRFPPNKNKDEAVWSQVGSNACPQSASSDVFHAIGVDEPARLTLTVNNPNPSPAQGKFGYTLRVTNDEGTTYLPLDPGGDNMNGSSRQFSAFAIFAVVATVAIVAVGLYELGVFGR